MGRDSAISRPIGRDSSKSPLTWGGGAQFHTSWICGRLCRILMGSWKISVVRGSAAGRFCGDGEISRGIPARPTTIRRNRHLLGTIGRNFVPRGSVVICVEYPRGRGKSPLFAGPPPGRLCGEGGASGELSPVPPRYGEIGTYMLRLSAISHLMDHWAIG